MEYLSIRALHERLLQISVEHTYKPLFNGYQIIVENHNSRISIVEHFGSYGNEKDKLEVWDFTSEPYGYMSIQECLDFLGKKGFLAKW